MSELKTIKQAFLDLYFSQDPLYPNEIKFVKAAEDFEKLYKLASPYKRYHSFKRLLYLRKKVSS